MKENEDNSTSISIKEYFDKRIDDLEKRVFERFTLNDLFLNKTEDALKDRLRGMNEFRDALKDQANRMATRIELEKVEKEVNLLQRSKAGLDGRLLVVYIVISIVSAAILRIIISIFTK